MPKSLAVGTATLLHLAGLAISAYLFARTLLLVLGKTGGAFDFCSAAFNTNCDATLLSDQSSVLGIPLAGWGIVYFVGLLALRVQSSLIGPKLATTAGATLVLTATVGSLVSILLLAMFAMGSVPVCPLCIVIHALNLLAWPLLYKAAGSTPGDLLRGVGTALSFVLGSKKSASIEDAPWKALSLLTTLLVGLVAYQWILGRYDRANAEADSNPSGAEILSQNQLQLLRDIPIADDDPRKGPKDGGIEFVIFSDFQCPGCRIMAERIDGYTENFGEFVTIVFKHYPLDMSCNENLGEPFHDVACRAARLSESAHEAGRFWEFHDAVYGLQESLTTEILDRLATDMDLDETSEAAQRQNEQRIARHIAEATALGVDATPAVFLNGRLIPNPTERVLDILVWHYVGVDLATVDESPINLQTHPEVPGTE